MAHPKFNPCNINKIVLPHEIIGKGLLISEQICGVLKFPKMQRNIARISALASKMGQIKKIKAIFYTNNKSLIRTFLI